MFSYEKKENKNNLQKMSRYISETDVLHLVKIITQLKFSFWSSL